MNEPTATGAVAVFDVDLPPGVAFIRSLGKMNVPVIAYSHLARPAGRFSRFTTEFRQCPNLADTDDFIEWLVREADQFDFVAPTSDFISFVVAEVDDRLGTDLAGGVGAPRGGAAVRDCLFKDRFARALEASGFPVPNWSAPTSVTDALAAAGKHGYPVVLKPRSHAGIGVARGLIADDDDDIREMFTPYVLRDNQRSALRHDPDLGHPIVQQMIRRPSLDCVSITGCLDRNGAVLAASATRKVDQWGRGLAIGTVFEAAEPPHFFDHAIDAVRQVLGSGVFEFEVLSDPTTGEYWGIDLNPRGYGQISLAIARGDDLPALWYRSAIGYPPITTTPATRRPATWRMGTPFYAGAVARIVTGPQRCRHARSMFDAVVQPTAGSMHAWSDPRPGIVHALAMLRHPGGLVRPYLVERDALDD